MSAGSGWALQVSIKEHLEADTALIAFFGGTPRIYDRVAADAQLPYAQFADWQTTEIDTDDARIDSHVLSIFVWSAYTGLKTVKGIAAAIEAALHDASLSLDGYALVDLSFIGAVFLEEPKDNLSRAEVRFRAVTQAIAS